MPPERDTVQNCPDELQGVFWENRRRPSEMNDRSRQIGSGVRCYRQRNVVEFGRLISEQG